LQEERACSKCPLAESCAYKNKVAISPNASLQDVATLITALYFRKSEEDSKQMAVFNSATVVLKALDDILTDLIDNNGIEWKLFLAELASIKQ